MFKFNIAVDPKRLSYWAKRSIYFKRDLRFNTFGNVADSSSLFFPSSTPFFKFVCKWWVCYKIKSLSSRKISENKPNNNIQNHACRYYNNLPRNDGKLLQFINNGTCTAQWICRNLFTQFTRLYNRQTSQNRWLPIRRMRRIGYEDWTYWQLYKAS